MVAVWVRFGVQLGLRQTPALINNYHIILIHHDRHVIHHLSIYWNGSSESIYWNGIQLQVGSHSSESIDVWHDDHYE